MTTQIIIIGTARTISSQLAALQCHKLVLSGPSIGGRERDKHTHSPKCSVVGCDKPFLAKGLCNMHYHRWRISGVTGDASRRFALPGKVQCTVQGCTELSLARQLCHFHYKRLLNSGDTGGLERKAARAGSLFSWLESNKDHKGDECLIWPFKSKDRKGYGLIYFNGRLTGAHRAMLELAKGPIPDGLEAAHSCGNGNIGCVNPRHLRAATRKENCSDMLAHGTLGRGVMAPSAKLTEAAVLDIFANLHLSNTELGKIHCVNKATINDIRHQRCWGWLTTPAVVPNGRQIEVGHDK